MRALPMVLPVVDLFAEIKVKLTHILFEVFQIRLKFRHMAKSCTGRNSPFSIARQGKGSIRGNDLARIA
jgi:hypothetical protein